METEILQELGLIRAYVFIIMCVFVIWFLLKIIESIEKIITGFKKAWETSFEEQMENFIDEGEYKKVIEKCKEKLEKRPNHINATWFIAKAYYYTEDKELSKKYFEKTLHLVPSWEESVNPYLEKLNGR